MERTVIDEASQIIQRLNEDGYRAYYVGGAVRDELLDRPSSDIDITTSAKPNEICLLFPRAHQMNTEHQTVLVRSGGYSIEVTTERGDSLVADLSHRDFTINAMAKSADGKLIDPLNGQKDLQQKVIRSVHPDKRILEDPLRMLRAIRFVSELNFQLDKQLLNAIKQHAYLLEQVAQERVIQEWEKLLKGAFVQQAFQFLKRSTLYRFFPGYPLSENEITKLLMMPVIDREASSAFRWVLFYVWIGRETDESVGRLLLSNELKRQIKNRLRMFRHRKDKNIDDWMLYQYGLETTRDVEHIRHLMGLEHEQHADVEKRFDALPIKSRKDLCVTGVDLMTARQKSAGPWIKEELESLEKQVINREVGHSKQDLLMWLERKGHNEE
ncbi:CCA tRNA nucleotidyltransferase [Alkalicoccobacillus murimartini]|uniref:tRNA nucleotidyltransferase (CCA-adding enzyme) n=1 Tax=Alkalicoccobacillus murimartini TaxID=171685 RepID=A0ABT9YFF4_9BACI|nr:CCA tRNA nucleotidyltransferase [Alkalicoccobacillus murimartini]MDQ0205947.1 tRNA nucleotidyltransferase (CCA-adding enzyme) [Alkalicoccobacillus murimartini]